MIKISDAEWRIMAILWKVEPRTMMQITKELYEETGWTKHTVITYLKRMEAKGLIRFEEGKKAKLYYSDVARRDAVIGEKNNFLNKVFGGNTGLMVSTLIKQGNFSGKDIDELIDLLENKKGEL